MLPSMKINPDGSSPIYALTCLVCKNSDIALEDAFASTAVSSRGAWSGTVYGQRNTLSAPHSAFGSNWP
jgi:hypothetical protein